MLHIGDIIFLQNAYRNFSNGKPIYWVIIQVMPTDKDMLLCMPITEIGPSDGYVFVGRTVDIGDVAVHTNQSQWLHAEYHLASNVLITKMEKGDVLAIRKDMINAIKGDGRDHGERWLRIESAEYYNYYEGLYRHSCVVSGEFGVEDFEEVH